ncbi:saccharopine dehydrogenase NADP-binding domain-containing protein [Massilia sp. BJB1822]|uniref:saccharopine dehydrogenase NADP-binding domain-containing protein n=1 Tax=Massilia sp. BJB1822 TaxID=2744470 RepID=UPI001593A7F0|nr:saccharopine dehydrogenase NADP-binding domain-containing protein [Massilia sp. BJB1822]NVE01897.1 saccharopine dehydrogenase NADP-binding domain-containing protein [Massilia sp. BJB1822]
MKAPLVAVLGAYGAVGLAVVEALRGQPAPLRLRLGGRRAALLEQLADPARPDDQLCVANAFDAAALARLCEGCDLVINCAGPAHRLFDLVGRAALAAGADYIDPAGGAPLQTSLAALAVADPRRRVVLSAGMLPGLSGILPRWLARGMAPGASLSVHIGTLDHFSLGAAEDYLAGMGDNESLAAWQDGRRLAGAARREHGVDLPFFPAGLTTHPYLHHEGEQLARALALKQARFYNVFDGAHLLAALGRLSGRRLDAVQLGSAARELVAAAALDLAGRKPYLRYLFQLDGSCDGAPCSRTLMVAASGAAAASGAMAALAAQALLAGEVPAGVHQGAEVLDAQRAVQRLRAGSALTAWQMLERAPHEAALEEGAL